MSTRATRRHAAPSSSAGKGEQLNLENINNIALGGKLIELERQKSWEEHENILKLLKELVAASYGLKPLSPKARQELLRLYYEGKLGSIETERIKVSPKYLPLILARTAPWSTVYILGPPGVGKTTAIQDLARMEADVLGRELIDVGELVESAEDIESAINDILKNINKYYLYSYVTGGEITREFYGIPVGAFANLEDILRLKNVGRSQVWQIPPRILLLTVQGEVMNRLIRKILNEVNAPRREVESVIESLMMGKLASPVTASEWVKKIINELMNNLPVGMLVIDEALQAFPEFVNYYLMPLAGERKWMSRRLSPFARLILIWNPPEYNEAVQSPPKPALRRAEIMEVSEPTVEEIWEYFLRKTSGMPPPPTWMKALLRTISIAGLLPTTEEMSEAVEKTLPYTTPATIVDFLMKLLSALYAFGYPNEQIRLSEIQPIAVEIARKVLSPKHVSLVRNFFTIHVPSGKELLSNPELFKKTINEYANKGMDILAKYRMLIELASALQAPPEVLQNKEMMEKYALEKAKQLLNFIEVNKAVLSPVDLDILLNLVGESPVQTEYAVKLLMTLSREARSRPELLPLISETISRILRAAIWSTAR